MERGVDQAGEPRARRTAAAADIAGTPIPEELVRRVVIEHVTPAVDNGRFFIKRTGGEAVAVQAVIFADGHEVISARVRYRHVRDGVHGSMAQCSPADWCEAPMAPGAPGTDRWSAEFLVEHQGWYEYAVSAWVDRFRSWSHDLKIKSDAGQDLATELLEGSLLVREAATRAAPLQGDAEWLLSQADALSEASPVGERVSLALSDDLARLMDVYADRTSATQSPPLRIWVDRDRARFSAWYELFPRSAGPDETRSGTFAEAATLLPPIADLGFDVLYLPPIHPIGRTFRKGRNNCLTAAPGDPGSPWAIGSDQGGHMAVDPGLGTLSDFDAFRAEAARLGLEVALDLAFQCSPDHPWVREHPEWFRHRPDGTIKYAENPPKKYQDIYPFDLESEDWRGLWRALLQVVLFWMDHGVRIFRVDNPHTKTFGFWEWLIDEVHRRDPGVIFLSEAFTRPAPMKFLAKSGFTQSYTYFTWRNSKSELVDYFTELTSTDVGEYLRPNLFTNTPDILHAYLQHGGRAAFEARLLLAATLGANYGIYSGFELCEGMAVPGSEEYADSEKYQFRKWDWGRSGHIKELIARVNSVRRQVRALQSDRTLRFHDTDNAELIAYSKSDAAGVVLVVVNLDPRHMQHGFVQAPITAAGIGGDQLFGARDLLDDVTYAWRGEWNYVRLDPGVRQGHIFRLEQTVRGSRDS